MAPTDVLKQEHEGIKVALKVLDRICADLEVGKQASIGHLEQLLEFIRVFADSCHHGKEEDVLFPALEKAGLPSAGGPVQVMLLEHSMGRNYVRQLGDAIAEYKKGNRAASIRIVENGRGYINLLSAHIMKENNILFPMAEVRLPEEEKRRVMRAFEQIETERIGPGRHEQFHEMLHQLNEAYKL